MAFAKKTFLSICFGVGIILPLVSSASMLTGFFNPSLLPHHEMMGLAPMLGSRSLLRENFRDMERVADGIIGTMLEDGCKSSVCKSNNTTETDQKELSALRGLQLRPRFDLQETGDGFVLTAFTPGLRKDELTIEVVEHPDSTPVLIIAGESNATSTVGAPTEGDAKMDQDANTIRSARASYSKFERRIRIPKSIDRSSVKADYNDGMLTVSMTRVVQAPAQSTKVMIR
mmetsp:Transcript_18351/g.37207  ORF Transcript_18351/g.37207 Transcript_18351/m.37207 type:complete len:229 (-) Transcript_18351:141-827(-)|eukprot:CAMPEP_0181312360 /NCGR_PEP_ID=MMETSP1101-20121128/13653_1 /TAXON_ID=46948 /ORGANISM="Rhodomonas abbreviata, Strain Caron Lab Isolate" /LENGTH=228 /DNA_ID=CAMNT_0023419201 /DNA_START=170 /DNA_END=856 /DNA_ORIENTATION=+